MSFTTPPTWVDNSSPALSAANLNILSTDLVDLDGRVTSNTSSIAAKVASVTAADSTITVAGTATAPTIAVNSIAESKVTNLTTDLAAKAPLASPTFTGTVTTAALTVGGALIAQKAVSTPAVALTDAATIAVDASLGSYFRVTLTASGHVFGTPSNPSDGQSITLEVIQDGTGSRTISTWNSPWTFGTTVTQPTLTTTAGKRDFLEFIYNSTAAKWYCLLVSKGY